MKPADAPLNNRASLFKQTEPPQSAYGTVHIIDVEQHSRLKIIIWGTVEDGKARRGIKSAYGTKITQFRLRSLAKAG